MKLVLEPRFLFDGSVEATARSATGHHSNGDHHGVDSSDHAISAVAHSDTSGHSLTETHTPGLWQPYVPNATQILFVDTQVANWQQLIVGVAANVQVGVGPRGRHLGVERRQEAVGGLGGGVQRPKGAAQRAIGKVPICSAASASPC